MAFRIDRSLALQKRTDILRWSNTSALEPAWDSRAKAAAKLIDSGARVLDLGCGRMALREYLPSNCSYRGCDLVPRDQNTIVCDLNAGEFPHKEAAESDVTVFLGVLEYIEDVRSFFSHLQESSRTIVMSYSPREWSRTVDRAGQGWFNALSLDDLKQLFNELGFRMVDLERIDSVQVLIKLCGPSLSRPPSPVVDLN